MKAILWLSRLAPPLLTPRNHRARFAQLNIIGWLRRRAIALSPCDLTARVAQLNAVRQRGGGVTLAPRDDGAGLANGEAVLWLFKRHVGSAGLFAPDDFAAWLRHLDVIWVGGSVGARLLAPDDLTAGLCDLDIVWVGDFVGSAGLLAPDDLTVRLCHLNVIWVGRGSVSPLAPGDDR